jgi:hypothetical protein
LLFLIAGRLPGPAPPIFQNPGILQNRENAKKNRDMAPELALSVPVPCVSMMLLDHRVIENP